VSSTLQCKDSGGFSPRPEPPSSSAPCRHDWKSSLPAFFAEWRRAFNRPNENLHFWQLRPEVGHPFNACRSVCYFVVSNPNTPTPVVVPTYTFPLTIMGVMNLLPFPK